MPTPHQLHDTTVLVTGASGFVGAHIALSLAQAGASVIAVRGQNPLAQEVAQASHSHACDLAKAQAVQTLLATYPANAIVHAAALARPNLCEQDPQQATRSNVDATANLLHAANTHNIPLIYISTDLVFDGTAAPAGGFTETHDPTPKSVYGQTKAQAEAHVLAYQAGIVARLSLVYGRRIGQHEGVLAWMRGGLARGETLSLFRDEWRTPVHTQDICTTIQALLLEALNPDKTPPQILHIAGAKRINRYDFGLRLAEVFGFSKDLLRATTQDANPQSAHRPRDVSLSSKLLQQHFQHTPMTPTQGLQQLFAQSQHT